MLPLLQQSHWCEKASLPGPGGPALSHFPGTFGKLRPPRVPRKWPFFFSAGRTPHSPGTAKCPGKNLGETLALIRLECCLLGKFLDDNGVEMSGLCRHPYTECTYIHAITHTHTITHTHAITHTYVITHTYMPSHMPSHIHMQPHNACSHIHTCSHVHSK